jgi:L-2-hydroxyglutarate oxidase LhgO
MDNIQTDCLILGGGVAGLAIASEASNFFDDCLLVEKNNILGEETSSRNSEVIHAGIYYDKDSLKSKLCLSGKQYLYEYLEARNIGFNKCGKFILSSNKRETQKLVEIKENADECGVRDLSFESNLIKNYDFLSYEECLFSPSTGIFDSHSYMRSLEGDFIDNGGIVVLGNKVEKVFKEKDAFKVLVHDLNNNFKYFLNTKIIINCLGVNAIKFSNEMHETERYKIKLLKGEYYSYSGKEKLAHLIYPIPKARSLGTHATIDLGYGIKFGPSAYEVENIDYKISNKQKPHFLKSIRSYWPDIDKDKLYPSYSGIRPLLDGYDDFLIEGNVFDENIVIDVLGYSSPGLTSSIATAKYVMNILNEF